MTPFIGALHFFVTFWAVLPYPLQSFMGTVFACVLGAGAVRWVRD